MPENCDFFRKSIFVGPLLVFLVQLVQRLKKQKTFFFKFCLLFVSSVDSKCCVEGRKEGKTTWRTMRMTGVKQQNVSSEHRVQDENTDFWTENKLPNVKIDTQKNLLFVWGTSTKALRWSRVVHKLFFGLVIKTHEREKSNFLYNKRLFFVIGNVYLCFFFFIMNQ